MRLSIAIKRICYVMIIASAGNQYFLLILPVSTSPCSIVTVMPAYFDARYCSTRRYVIENLEELSFQPLVSRLQLVHGLILTLLLKFYILLYLHFSGIFRHLGYRQNCASDNVVINPIVIVDPENIWGRHRRVMFVFRYQSTLGTLTTSCCVRVKIGPRPRALFPFLIFQSGSSSAF